MIFGIGCDIAEVSRFEKWVKDESLCSRFFNERERWKGSLKNTSPACQHYAARFAAKEAFVKALGTGFLGVELKDLWVEKTGDGQPYYCFSSSLRQKIDERVRGKWTCFLSLSHEKNYAVATAVIELK